MPDKFSLPSMGGAEYLRLLDGCSPLTPHETLLNGLRLKQPLLDVLRTTPPPPVTEMFSRKCKDDNEEEYLVLYTELTGLW